MKARHNSGEPNTFLLFVLQSGNGFNGLVAHSLVATAVGGNGLGGLYHARNHNRVVVPSESFKQGFLRVGIGLRQIVDEHRYEPVCM